MLKLLKTLSGNESKIFFILLIAVNDDYEYTNMESLKEFDFSYPTILQSVERLVEIECIKKIDNGSSSVLVLNYDYRVLSDLIKESFDSKELFVEFGKEKKRKLPKVDGDDLKAVIIHYAIEQGISIDDITTDFYKKNCSSAKELLFRCGTVEGAKKAISNCRLIRQRDGLDWSLRGDVLNNLHKFFNKNQRQGEPKKWE